MIRLKMKLISKVIASALLISSALVLASCGGRQKSEEVSFTDTLTQKDTATVISLADACLDSLQVGNFNGKGYRLGYFIDDTLYPIEADRAEEFFPLLTKVKILSYERIGLTFDSEYDNQVTYRLVCSDGKDTITTKLALCPIYIEEQWYLTLK